MSLENSDPQEAELRSLFHQLKQQDKEKVPDFRSLVTRARTAQRRRPGRPAVLLAAALILIAVILAIFAKKGNEGLTESYAIVSWRSPTDFLLRPPAETFLRKTPELGKSLLEFDARNLNMEEL